MTISRKEKKNNKNEEQEFLTFLEEVSWKAKVQEASPVSYEERFKGLETKL